MVSPANRILMLSSRYAIGNVARPVLAFFLIPLYTIYLVPADYGILAILAIAGAVVMRTIDTPFASALHRFYYHPDYAEQKGALLFNLGLVVLAKVTVVALLFLLLAPTVSAWLFGSTQYVAVVRLYSAILWLAPLSGLLAALVLMLERAWLYNILTLLNVVITVAVTVAMLVFLEWGVMGVVIGQIAGHLFMTAATVPILWKIIQPRWSFALVRAPLRFGYSTLPAGVSNVAVQTGDQYVLSIMVSMHQLGLFAFGSYIASVLPMLFGAPLTNGILPTIRQLEHDRERQRAFARQATTFLCVAGVFLALGISLYARDIIWLLASQAAFWPAWTVVPIIAFSHILHTLAGFTQTGICLGNRPGYVSAVVVIVALLNLGLNFVLIPLLGIHGAALATLVSFLVWNLLNVHFSARFYEMRFDLRRAGHAFLCGGGVLAVGLLLPTGMAWWLSLLLKGSILMGYPGLLLATGFFQRPEREWLIRLLQRARSAGPIATARTLLVLKVQS